MGGIVELVSGAFGVTGVIVGIVMLALYILGQKEEEKTRKESAENAAATPDRPKPPGTDQLPTAPESKSTPATPKPERFLAKDLGKKDDWKNKL